MTLAPHPFGSAGVSGFGFGGMLFGGLLMIAFWVLIIVGVVWLVVTLARNNASPIPTTASRQTPFATLRVQARYAKGEITKEQFEEMRRDLGA